MKAGVEFKESLSKEAVRSFSRFGPRCHYGSSLAYGHLDMCALFRAAFFLAISWVFVVLVMFLAEPRNTVKVSQRDPWDFLPRLWGQCASFCNAGKTIFAWILISYVSNVKSLPAWDPSQVNIQALASIWFASSRILFWVCKVRVIVPPSFSILIGGYSIFWCSSSTWNHTQDDNNIILFY